MKYLFTIIALSLAIIAHSQDLVAFANGDTLTGKITGLNENNIYLKNESGRNKYALADVGTYTFRNVWYYANGDRVDAGSIMRNNTAHIPVANFSGYLVEAGNALVIGTVVSILLATTSVLVDNDTMQTWLAVGSGVVFAGTLIITGSKISMAGNSYGLE